MVNVTKTWTDSLTDTAKAIQSHPDSMKYAGGAVVGMALMYSAQKSVETARLKFFPTDQEQVQQELQAQVNNLKATLGTQITNMEQLEAKHQTELRDLAQRLKAEHKIDKERAIGSNNFQWKAIMVLTIAAQAYLQPKFTSGFSAITSIFSSGK